MDTVWMKMEHGSSKVDENYIKCKEYGAVASAAALFLALSGNRKYFLSISIKDIHMIKLSNKIIT